MNQYEHFQFQLGGPFTSKNLAIMNYFVKMASQDAAMTGDLTEKLFQVKQLGF